MTLWHECCPFSPHFLVGYFKTPAIKLDKLNRIQLPNCTFKIRPSQNPKGTTESLNKWLALRGTKQPIKNVLTPHLMTWCPRFQIYCAYQEYDMVYQWLWKIQTEVPLGCGHHSAMDGWMDIFWLRLEWMSYPIGQLHAVTMAMLATPTTISCYIFYWPMDHFPTA